MTRLDAIEACNRAAVMKPAIVRTRAEGFSCGRVDGVCPTHDSPECVETFYAQSMLARLSLIQMWTLWRSWRKAARR